MHPSLHCRARDPTSSVHHWSFFSFPVHHFPPSACAPLLHSRPPFFVRIKETFTAGHMPHDFTTNLNLLPCFSPASARPTFCKARREPVRMRQEWSPQAGFNAPLCPFLNGNSSSLSLTLHYGELRVLMHGKTRLFARFKWFTCLKYPMALLLYASTKSLKNLDQTLLLW